MHRPLLLIAFPAVLLAQPAALQLNVLYECPPVQATMQIYSCAGPAATDACDVQTAPQGRPAMRGKAPRQQVVALLALCHPQTPAEAQARARNVGPAGQPAAAAAGPGGLKVGDRVRVLINGWEPAQVLQIHGNFFTVRTTNGIEVSKQWPFEIHREGQLTAADHAAGQYDLHDRVQVNINGRWAEGQIVGQRDNMYTIKVPGYRGDFDSDTVDTTANNIRVSTTPLPPPAAKRAAGQPPKAGLASCAGKFEGRYEMVQAGGFRVVFRSGKATVTEALTPQPHEYECFTGGGEVVLYEAGAFKATETFEINNDGTLQWELGAMKKMGN